jgi:glyoxylase-like metal-dependent hydrolase (beta-lactamase superfamily II)
MLLYVRNRNEHKKSAYCAQHSRIDDRPYRIDCRSDCPSVAPLPFYSPMTTLTSLLGNTQKLDGGAMFGHVPKALWSRWLPADDQNRVALHCRALLIQEPHRNILLETGIGAFFDPALKERYGVEEPQHVLLDSLAAQGLSHTDIDIVVLSHLHFDHAGGLLDAWQKDQPPSLLFPKAQYLVSQGAWERAQHPHLRDRASFLPALHLLLEASQRLHLVEGETHPLLGPGYCFLYSDGHTPAMMHTVVSMPAGPVIFAADLIPGTSWLHLPICMGYDRAPEQLIQEKKTLLEWILQENGRLFYTHDPNIAISRVMLDEKGHFSAIEKLPDITKLEA